MKTSMIALSPTLQGLIDERLDAMERVLLMGSVSRGERREILGEVETQIFELLGRRVSGEPTRDDLLKVLSQIDPPESYAPDGFDRRASAPSRSAPQDRKPRLSLLALGSAAVGAFAVPAFLAGLLLFENWDLTLAAALTIAAVSVVGCYSLFRIHVSQGTLSGSRPGVFAATLFPLLAANGFACLAFGELSDVIILACVAITFLCVNGASIYFAWRTFLSSISRPTHAA